MKNPEGSLSGLEGLFAMFRLFQYITWGYYVTVGTLVLSILILIVIVIKQRRRIRNLRDDLRLTQLAAELDRVLPPNPQQQRELRMAQIDGHAPRPQAPPKQDPAEALRRKVAASLGEQGEGSNRPQGKVTSSNTFDI